MTVVNIPAQVTLDTLVKAIVQLPSEDFDDLMMRVNFVRQIQTTEPVLLKVIDQHLPADQQRRLAVLRDKLESETLTESERAELLNLVDVSEALNVSRTEALLTLAQKRGVSVQQLMNDLGLEPQLD